MSETERPAAAELKPEQTKSDLALGILRNLYGKAGIGQAFEGTLFAVHRGMVILFQVDDVIEGKARQAYRRDTLGDHQEAPFHGFAPHSEISIGELVNYYLGVNEEIERD